MTGRAPLSKVDSPGNKRGNPQFKKGTSGNPKGPPVYPEHFKEACRLAAWEHLDVVTDICRNSGDEKMQLRAWELLAQRGFGLPKQEIDVTSAGEQVYQPVIYAQPPSETPEEWMARHKPKGDPEKLN